MSDEWRHKRMGVKMWWMDHNDIIAFFCRSIISVREFRHSFTPRRARFRLILASSVNQPENDWRRVKRWRQTEKKTREGRIKIPKIMVFQSIIHSIWQTKVDGSRLTCPNIDSGAEWFRSTSRKLVLFAERNIDWTKWSRSADGRTFSPLPPRNSSTRRWIAHGFSIDSLMNSQRDCFYGENFRNFCVNIAVCMTTKRCCLAITV